MKALGDLLHSEMDRLDAFAKRTTGKSIAEIDAEFTRRRGTLLSMPDKLQRMMEKPKSTQERLDWESQYGVEDGDFIRVFSRPGNSDRFVPNRWALSPFKFGPAIQQHGLMVPDIMRTELGDEWKRFIGERWTDRDYQAYAALMDRNREIAWSKGIRIHGVRA